MNRSILAVILVVFFGGLAFVTWEFLVPKPDDQPIVFTPPPTPPGYNERIGKEDPDAGLPKFFPAEPAVTALDKPAGGEVGLVDAVKGQHVRLVRGGKNMTPAKGETIYAQDLIVTGPQSRIRVKLGDGSVLNQGSNSQSVVNQFSYKDGESREVKFELSFGKILLDIRKWAHGGRNEFEVKSPSVVAGIRGTTIWADVEQDAMCVLEGKIAAKSRQDETKPEIEVPAGKGLKDLSSGKMTVFDVTPDDEKAYKDSILITD
ncbi:MAG: hypothetical protein GMKNLPBB_02937 [Myxococcota bacterium]|nr:hypothetical protein [Myxococcota bacterium]